MNGELIHDGSLVDGGPDVSTEAARRRTFAVISHPDAGKTTLTEKILLYAGCIEEAGAVRGRKTTRAVTSDWMSLERERGISVSATAASFEYRGLVMNLLDTPGHHDFSEDTYRTLVAADCAIMLLDAAKGVETQTRKLFRVCRQRRCPIVTLVNKMDRPGARTFDVLDEIEETLGIETTPLNWPIGAGPDFQGVYDRLSESALLFERAAQGSLQAPIRRVALDELERHHVGRDCAATTRESVEVITNACPPFDNDRFLAGDLTPVFFASASNNFGIEPFLDSFVRLCPSPIPRITSAGPLPIDRSGFAGFVFKLQGNLNPKHRDQVAFVRICSGVFRPEAPLQLARTGKSLRIKAAYRLFGRERQETVEAYPGDIVALVSSGGFRVGDSVYERQPVVFEPLPRFPAERFATLKCVSLERRKQFEVGMKALANEGVIQAFFDPTTPREAILGAVGDLQFDVVRFRLESEYDTKTAIEPARFKGAAWIKSGASEAALRLPYSALRAVDHCGQMTVLVEHDWEIRHLREMNPPGVVEG